MKILFLDVDGVVNKKENFDPALNAGPFPIDAYCAFLVGRIQLLTGCSVVLSSSWRHMPEGVKNVSERVVEPYDVTPSVGKCRGDEIQAWLDTHEVEKYAILDDEADMLVSQAPNFFQTTFDEGLTDEIADAIVDHLGRI